MASTGGGGGRGEHAGGPAYNHAPPPACARVPFAPASLGECVEWPRADRRAVRPLLGVAARSVWPRSPPAPLHPCCPASTYVTARPSLLFSSRSECRSHLRDQDPAGSFAPPSPKLPALHAGSSPHPRSAISAHAPRCRLADDARSSRGRACPRTGSLRARPWCCSKGPVPDTASSCGGPALRVTGAPIVAHARPLAGQHAVAASSPARPPHCLEV